MTNPAQTEQAPSSCREALVAQLRADQPESVLVVGPQPERLLGAYLDEAAQQLTKVPGPGLRTEIEQAGVHEAAVVAHALEGLGKTEGGRLISALRDLYARTLYVAVTVEPSSTPGGHGWVHRDMIALGLSLLCELDETGAERLYYYSLYDYKKTPDWLNPRYWANPELWDKYRW